jgi:hypothetical protein
MRKLPSRWQCRSVFGSRSKKSSVREPIGGI